MHGSDGSIRWFESGREQGRQDNAAAVAATSTASKGGGKASDGGKGKGKKDAKGKGSPKGKGKKGAKTAAGDEDGNEVIETPFEGMCHLHYLLSHTSHEH